MRNAIPTASKLLVGSSVELGFQYNVIYYLLILANRVEAHLALISKLKRKAVELAVLQKRFLLFGPVKFC